MSTGEPRDLDALADEALATHGGFGDNWKIRTIKAVREQSRGWTLREIGQAVDRAVERRGRPSTGEPLNLDAIKKRVGAASEGPWWHGDDGLVWAPRAGDPVSGSTEIADAVFIAHAREDVPALLSEVERLNKRIHDAHDALTRIDGADDDSFTTLESTVDYVVNSHRAIAESEAQAADQIDALRAERDRLGDELGAALEQLHIQRGES
jgi:hypothetical protein